MKMKKIISLSDSPASQERLKVAKRIYVDIFKQCELQENEVLRKNDKTNDDYEGLEFLNCVKEELKLDHCFFIAWYLSNEVNNEDGWYKLNLQLVGEVILIFPLVRKVGAWKNIPLFNEIFPTCTGITLKHFQDYFKFVETLELELCLKTIKSTYWNDPTDYDPDQFGIPFTTKGEDN